MGVVATALLVTIGAFGRADAGEGSPTKSPVSGVSSEVKPVRKGFTLQLSMGVANHAFVSGKQTTGYWGLGGLNLALGGFLNSRMALLFLVQGANFGPFNSNEFASGVGGTGGPALQVWFGDRFSVAAGVGIGFYSSMAQGTLSATQKAGLGLMVQSTLSLVALEHHALGLYAGLSGAVLSGLGTLIPQFGLVWQYH